MNLEQVKAFDRGANRSGCDLLDYADAMVWINNFVAYLEVQQISIHHEGHPLGCRLKQGESTLAMISDSDGAVKFAAIYEGSSTFGHVRRAFGGPQKVALWTEILVG